jgi:hypothetical protein
MFESLSLLAHPVEDDTHARADNHINEIEEKTEKKDSHDHHERRPGQLVTRGPGDVVQFLPRFLDELDRVPEGVFDLLKEIFHFTDSARALGRRCNPDKTGGRPGGTRTPNMRFWRPPLYQFELLACKLLSSKINPGAWPLTGLLVRRMSPASIAELLELEPLGRLLFVLG